MAWSDEPTDAQVSTLYRCLQWRIPTETAKAAVEWLRENATRKEYADEITRIKKLEMSRNLTRDRCFSSIIWEGFGYEDD